MLDISKTPVHRAPREERLCEAEVVSKIASAIRSAIKKRYGSVNVKVHNNVLTVESTEAQRFTIDPV